ncbi:MAG TPA: hypothetical protein PLJ04_03255 [Candidatus Saccharibacteria bacterium]|nr:hypothetical protein [Candidatus Saccharibacteria bacterium]
MIAIHIIGQTQRVVNTGSVELAKKNALNYAGKIVSFIDTMLSMGEGS